MNTNKTIKEYTDYLPIKQIEDNKMVNGTLDITIGFKIILPELFTLNEVSAKQMEEKLVAFLKILPSGTIFQKLDYVYIEKYIASRDISNKILRENVEYNIGKPVTRHYSEIFITFPDKIIINKPRIANTVYKEISIFNNPFGNITQKKFKDIEQMAVNISNVLNSISNVKMFRMNDYELATCVYKYMSQNIEQNLPGDESIKNEVIEPMGYDKKGQLRIGSKFISVITLSEEGPVLRPATTPNISPSSIYNNGINFSNTIKSKASMVYGLGIGLPVNHVLVTTIQVLDNDLIKTFLDVESRKLNFSSALGHRASRKKQETIKEYLDSVDNHGLTPCIVSVNVIIQANNMEDLQNYNGICKNHFLFMNQSKGYIEVNDAQTMFMLNCPGNANFNFRTFTSITQNAVCYLHKETHYISDPEGIILQDRWGNPTVVQLFENKLTTNSNKVLFAPSGGGKVCIF